MFMKMTSQHSTFFSNTIKSSVDRDPFPPLFAHIPVVFLVSASQKKYQQNWMTKLLVRRSSLFQQCMPAFR